jgi:hypothetical protein
MSFTPYLPPKASALPPLNNLFTFPSLKSSVRKSVERDRRGGLRSIFTAAFEHRRLKGILPLV